MVVLDRISPAGSCLSRKIRWPDPSMEERRGGLIYFWFYKYQISKLNYFARDYQTHQWWRHSQSRSIWSTIPRKTADWKLHPVCYFIVLKEHFGKLFMAGIGGWLFLEFSSFYIFLIQILIIEIFLGIRIDRWDVTQTIFFIVEGSKGKR